MASPRIGYAPGVFDLFHIGHLNLLRRSRRFCDHLVVGVVSDQLAEQVKGITPVVPLAERLAIVASNRFVDEAVVEDVPDKLAMWARVHFDVIIKGDDWRGTVEGRRLEADFARVGVAVVYLPYTRGTSSTARRGIVRSLPAS